MALLAAAISSHDASAQQKQVPAPKAPPKQEKGPAPKREALRTGPRSLRDVLRGQLRSSDTITIDANVAEDVRRIWAREYKVASLPRAAGANPNEPVVRILDPILKEMEPHLPALRQTFKKHGVP